jgi:autotransporter strand-loop-strand O-heptosyltransferase
MKIINVTPGLIPIPPNGWGAVEKIIWEFHNNLMALGHDSHITYLDDIPSDADIVHIHVANLALMAKERGIPYYFTMHDHHSYLNGKDSFTYKENLEAMKGAIRSFVPAKYLVEYFEGVPEYFSHGVNSLYFSPPNTRIKKHNLLCVANNGYAHDQTIDRKGFGIAIEAAKSLGLPITIAGPSNNKQYFEKYPSNYNKLTIKYDLTEDELRELYRTHSIFVHPSELEAGHPNLTLLEAMACGLPVVGTFEEHNRLQGMVVSTRNPLTLALRIQDVIFEYQQYTQDARQQAEVLSWHNRTKELVTLYKQGKSTTMKEQLLHHYSNTPILKKSIVPKFNFNCINGMFVEIIGGPDTTYSVKFIDKKTNISIFKTEIGRNCWARSNVTYYVDWRVEIQDNNSDFTYTYDLNLHNARVYIALDSKSLGDTIAWFPYAEEFRKKHNCQVICSTFWNEFFQDEYPHITFVKPGETVPNLTGMYAIGLFYVDQKFDTNKHPSNPIHIGLQQLSSDILGLPYTEVRPKIKQPTVDNTDSKLITIAVHSTAQSKYWNNPVGWQQIVYWLKERGYTVKLLSHEEDGYMGNKNPIGVEHVPHSSIENVIHELTHSKAFIGISSGLSWLSWAVGTPTVMISGFTEPFNEMQDCIRIAAPHGKCTGCWSRHKFNPGDWNWCPDHKNTPRQFECSKNITAEMVIRELEKVL